MGQPGKQQVRIEEIVRERMLAEIIEERDSLILTMKQEIVILTNENDALKNEAEGLKEIIANFGKNDSSEKKKK